jgi:hypothetical protein
LDAPNSARAPEPGRESESAAAARAARGGGRFCGCEARAGRASEST